MCAFVNVRVLDNIVVICLSVAFQISCLFFTHGCFGQKTRYLTLRIIKSRFYAPN